VEFFGVLRCAQDDGKNRQRPTTGTSNGRTGNRRTGNGQEQEQATAEQATAEQATAEQAAAEQATAKQVRIRDGCDQFRREFGSAREWVADGYMGVDGDCGWGGSDSSADEQSLWVSSR
jgi:hypothetical protein